jgi:sodium transport system ATP-binding protein
MIQFEAVRRTFDDFVAVDDLSFEVHPGEVVGLLGPNGAGKTTALRMLATLIKPTSGRILVQGRDTVADSLAVRHVLGYQTGDTGLYGRLNPIEFLRYFGQLHGMSRQTIQERTHTLIDQLDMGTFANKLCATLSTGQKQRVSLARTLLHDPPVLVLDEPTNGLDIVSSHFVVDALRHAAAQGKAVIFSSHIMSDVELASDRLVIVHHGRLIATGTIPDIIAEQSASSLSQAFLKLVHASNAVAGRTTGGAA